MLKKEGHRKGMGPAKGLAVLYFVVFVSFLDTHAQMPILASYASSLGAAPFLIGLTVGVYSFTNIVGNGISGTVMDRSGWRVPLITGLFIASMSLFGYALADDAYILLAVRALHGIGGGLLIPATLMAVSEGCGEETLKGRMARYGIVIGTAAFIGPMFAGVSTASYGFSATYLVLASVMMLSFTIVLSTVRHIPRDVERRPPGEGGLRVTPGLAVSFIAAFATMGATGTLVSFMPEHGSSIGLDSSIIGMGFASFALTAIVMQVYWPKKLAQVLSPTHGCTLGISLMISSLVTLPFSSSAGTLFLAMVLFGAGFGIVFPSMLILVHSGDSGDRGRMMALFFVFYSLGVAVIPPVAGYLYEFNGITPTLTSALVCFISLPVILHIAKRI